MSGSDALPYQSLGTDSVRNLGWRVTFAGMGINLALGVLYSWSVLKKAIPAGWGWSDFEKTLPYSLACLVFAIVMIPAGRAQDRLGPRRVALAGGITVGLGMIIASLTTSVVGFVLGFGVLAGAGIGMGYAAATPAAVKWFGPRRTGMIAGLVVAGFGLASVYIAPLAQFLINTFSEGEGAARNTGPGVAATMLILGIMFLVAVSILSQLLAVPPAGWKPEMLVREGIAKPKALVDFSWTAMLRMPQFYMMWVMYAFAAGAGLMVIAHLAKIVSLQARIEAGFVFVAFLAIGNAGGRVIAGMLSDTIGRRNTMIIVFVFQAALMFAMPMVNQFWMFVIVSMLLGANYGANLALFPAMTKDYFGLKNFGVNYGWVFTAWGVGGLLLAQISGAVYDASKNANLQALIAKGVPVAEATKQAVGNYDLAYTIAGVCLLVAAVIALLLKAPSWTATAQPTPGDKTQEVVPGAQPPTK